jgi:NAD(P)-dependent dehydrogenase (short-subunit alcohol dehydrogenase family)
VVAEQTLLVTGSTDGLGRHVAARLVERGATVLIHGRHPDRVEQVRAEIGAERGYVADLASLEQTRRLPTRSDATTSGYRCSSTTPASSAPRAASAS